MRIVKGKVSVWVNKVPPSSYPRSYLKEHYQREDDGPLCEWAGSFGFNWYDHDFMEVARKRGKPQPIRNLLKGHSYAETFVGQVEKAAAKAGIDRANHSILLFDFDYAARRRKIKEDSYMRFLGTFEYHYDEDELTEIYGP
jgi:hypothetical protein